MNKKTLVIIIIFLGLIQIGSIYGFLNVKEASVNIEKQKANSFPQSDSKKEDLPIHSSYFSSKLFYEEAYANLPEFDNSFNKTEKIYGGIVPHHLIVKNHIASFFSGLENQDIKTVILIGPNHFNNGKEKIITSRAIWRTPFGELEPELNIIDKIARLENAEIDEAPFVLEHSISGLVGFIKKSIPEAKIVPIILKVNLEEESALRLAKKIFDNVDKESTLVISSVDFSHYMPAQVADFHDERSNGIINDFDFERVYSMEIDSQPSIYTLLKYLDGIDAEKSELLFHTNSGTMIDNYDNPTTTHNFHYFYKGEKQDKNIVNLMFFGDLMLDRDVKTVFERKGFDSMFEKIKGEENRFFQGVDIIGANLEGTVTEEGKHHKPEFAYDFAFDPENIKKLKKYNFNYFTLANNHFSDQGERGIIETREKLNSLDFYFSGCKDKVVSEECSSKIIDVSGKKIGLIGFSMVYGVFDMKKAEEIVSSVASSTDFTVVNIHWSKEYVHEINSTQRDKGKALIDFGADVIIGHHPHVVQGMEMYKNKPIFYSLGNFIFDQTKGYFPKDNRQGLIVGITVSEKSAKYNLFPFDFENFQLELLKGEKKKTFFSDFNNWSVLSEDLKEKLINNVIEVEL